MRKEVSFIKATIISLSSGAIMLLAILAPVTGLVQGLLPTGNNVSTNTTADVSTNTGSTSVSATNQTSASVLGNTASAGLTAQISL